MKHIGITSLVLGLIGLALNLYYIYEYQQFLDIAGGLNELISIYIFSELESQLIAISQVIGIVLGVVGIKKRITKKVSIAGALLCFSNLVLFIII